MFSDKGKEGTCTTCLCLCLRTSILATAVFGERRSLHLKPHTDQGFVLCAWQCLVSAQ